MMLIIGRPLRKDEDVHHINANKLDFRERNLQLLSHSYHGWVSSKQRWYMRQREQQERKWYAEYNLVDDEGVSDILPAGSSVVSVCMASAMPVQQEG